MHKSKTVLLLPALVLSIILSFAALQPSTAQEEASTCHESPIQTLFFYKPVENITMEWMMKNTDYYIFTKNDENELAQAKEAGEGPVLQYMKYDAINDPCFQAMNEPGTPCSCDRNPLNNNVGWQPEDICFIRDNHPEWFLRGADGELLYFQNNVMMDPGQQGWRDFWVSRLEEYHAQYPWDGLFIDNLGTKFGMHSANFVPLQQYENDEVYRDTVVDFFTDVRERYFDPKGMPIYANVSVYRGDLPVYERYLDFLEGTMDEFWAYPREGFYSARDWESRLNRMNETLKAGKEVFLVAQGEWENHERMRFGLASYLLIASDQTYFRYTRQGSYERSWLYDEYRMPLGEPLGEFRTDGTTWRRDFANGVVSVTPETQSYTITVFNPRAACRR
jgi:hypothetical protein